MTKIPNEFMSRFRFGVAGSQAQFFLGSRVQALLYRSWRRSDFFRSTQWLTGCDWASSFHYVVACYSIFSLSLSLSVCLCLSHAHIHQCLFNNKETLMFTILFLSAGRGMNVDYRQHVCQIYLRFKLFQLVVSTS